MVEVAREDEFQRRRKAVCEGLSARSLGALITDRPDTVRYLTGYPVSVVGGRPTIVILLANNKLIVLAGTQVGGAIGRDVPTARIEFFGPPAAAPADLRLPDGALHFATSAYERLRSVLASEGVHRAAVDGLDAAYPPVSRLDLVLPDVDLEIESDLIWALRSRKSDWELDQLRTAANRVAEAFDVVSPQIRPGMTELDVQRLMSVAVLEAGSGLYFATAVVVEDGRDILGNQTDRVWGDGELLCIDAGASVEGYTSDFCRTYVAGQPSDLQVETYQRVVDARDAALAIFKPGITAGEIASEMLRVLGNRPEEVAGRMGHGLGLGLEPPSLNPADPTVMVDGTVFCLEPAIVVDGSYYTLEEEYAVRDGQLELLSPLAPRELIIV